MAGTDQNAPAEDPDPLEDTPDPQVEEGDEADVQPEPDQDVDGRLKAKDQLITRQQQELVRLRAQAATSTGAGTADPSLSALEADSWILAESVYGVDAIEAYRTAAELLDAAVTPADHLAAFEAYHQARTGESATPAQAQSVNPTRAQATTPKVDTNRSDLSPDLQDADQKLSEARKGKDLGAFTDAAVRRLGFGTKS